MRLESFPIQEFLSQFKSSKGKIRESVQTYLLQTFAELIQQKVIEPSFSIQSRTKDTKLIQVQNLTRKDLRKAKHILVMEKI